MAGATDVHSTDDDDDDDLDKQIEELVALIPQLSPEKLLEIISTLDQWVACVTSPSS